MRKRSAKITLAIALFFGLIGAGAFAWLTWLAVYKTAGVGENRFVAVPGECIKALLEIPSNTSGFFNSDKYFLTVNGFVGAVVFMGIYGLWRLLLYDFREDQ